MKHHCQNLTSFFKTLTKGNVQISKFGALYILGMSQLSWTQTYLRLSSYFIKLSSAVVHQKIHFRPLYLCVGNCSMKLGNWCENLLPWDEVLVLFAAYLVVSVLDERFYCQ